MTIAAIARGAFAAYKVGKTLYESRGIFEESPQAIMRDAYDPSVPAGEVLVRARIRSHTGRLLAAAQRAVASRPSTLEQIGNFFG
jgi:hypothetical protein